MPTYLPPVDSPADLLQVAQSDSHLILTKDETSMLMNFIYARPGTGGQLFHAIGVHMNRTARPMIETMDDLISTVEEAEGNPSYRKPVVAIATRINLMVRRQLFAKKPLHIGTQGIEQNQIAIPLQRRSPLRKPFNIM